MHPVFQLRTKNVLEYACTTIVVLIREKESVRVKLLCCYQLGAFFFKLEALDSTTSLKAQDVHDYAYIFHPSTPQVYNSMDRELLCQLSGQLRIPDTHADQVPASSTRGQRSAMLCIELLIAQRLGYPNC